MIFYTDYPFTELGDEPYKIAPIRKVMIESYDDNKYCEIWVEGKLLTVKAGYLYSKHGRLGKVPVVKDETLKKYIKG